jgi:hypothetical protein
MSTLGGRVGNTLLLILHLDDMRLENDYQNKDLKGIITSLNNVIINAVSESMTGLAFTHSDVNYSVHQFVSLSPPCMPKSGERSISLAVVRYTRAADTASC